LQALHGVALHESGFDLWFPCSAQFLVRAAVAALGGRAAATVALIVTLLLGQHDFPVQPLHVVVPQSYTEDMNENENQKEMAEFIQQWIAATEGNGLSDIENAWHGWNAWNGWQQLVSQS
jgi:hypothetical protein